VQPDRFRAFETFQKACTAGDALGCSFLGDMHRSGTAPDSKVDQAFSLFKRACSGGLSQGCVELGVMYEQGVATPRDYKQAISQYERACRVDNQDGCAHMGILYSSDRKGVGLDRAKAMEYFRTACDKNSALGCTELGNTYVRGAGMDSKKQSENDKEAARLYEKACGLWGGAEGCARLGTLMVYGWGVTKDTYAGVVNFEKGCNQGSGYACVELYAQGQGVPKDPAMAAKLRSESCNRGSTLGCRNLALMYKDGVGVPKKDLEAAAKLHEKACYLRSSLDCYELAVAHDKGDGVKKDQKLVAKFFQRACTFGSNEACSNLGYFIFKGAAEYTKDPTLGVSKLRYACSNYSARWREEKEKIKNVWACGALKRLNQKLQGPAPVGLPPPLGGYGQGAGTQKM